MAGYFAGAGGGTGWLSDARLVNLWSESPKPRDRSPNELPVAAGWQPVGAVQAGAGAICVTAIWASGTATQPLRAIAKAPATIGVIMKTRWNGIG